MIPFLDIKAINARFTSAFNEALSTVMQNGHYILGPSVSKFEHQFASFCGTKYCIGTANGLDALTLILKGYMHLGKLQKGDKVIVPANTFVATILSVLHADLVPVLVEPNPKTYTISPQEVNTHITSQVKAIIMVHLYGQLADVKALNRIAKHNNLLLIEDAAQAHGANLTLDNNTYFAGNLADAAAFSFYPTKNLGALGDGGAVTTNNDALKHAISKLRNYGSSKKYENNIIGYNSRLHELQAAFLSIKLPHLQSDNIARKTIAKYYLTHITNSKIKLPEVSDTNSHVFYAFVIQVENRKAFTNYLDAHHIEWLIHYPIAPHQQKALTHLATLHLPITELIHKTVVSLPISPLLTKAQAEAVVQCINNY